MGGLVGTNTIRNVNSAPMVSYANLSRSAITVPASLLISQNVTLKGFNLYRYAPPASLHA